MDSTMATTSHYYTTRKYKDCFDTTTHFRALCFAEELIKGPENFINFLNQFLEVKSCMDIIS